ncbi:TPA: hypothetical protein R2318_000199 [Legionella pneumophila]|nr:hypothetical protein [Legionella pneumophila]HAT8333753.1 hypothetical protein [Legionella pneumophila]HAU2316445.1 hypothetical protein [Legionella pneumophila]HCJ1049161.1 hypothetical protein [Legionella pneumophila]HDV5685173.1 hypothetical protein [Legionella pneumophila]
MEPKIKINLNDNNLNILHAILNHAHDDRFKNYPELDIILNEGLDKEQWQNIKEYAKTVSEFLGMKQGNNFASAWDKEEFLRTIDAALKK